MDPQGPSFLKEGPMSLSVVPLVRAFARTEDARVSVLERAVSTVEIVKESGAPWMAFLVPENYDDADAFSGLEALFDPDDFVKIFKVSGHHSCAALNEGCELLFEEGATHALILSGKAAHFLTTEVYAQVCRSHKAGACVVGAAIGDLADVVREGIPQNTFASWDIIALEAVGGFQNELGVEEIDPLVKFCQMARAMRAGKIIEIIDGLAGSLSIRTDAEAQRRHDEVMATKRGRQDEILEALGFPREEFREWVR